MTRSPTPSRRMRSSASATVLSASKSGKSLRACSATGELKSGMPAVSGIPNFYAMNDAFALQNLLRFAEIIADVGLGADPIDVTLNSLFQLDLRFVTGRTDFLCVACEMSHFAGTKFAPRFRLDVDLKGGGNDFGNFANRYAFLAANIYRDAVQLIGLGREQVRARDIFDK